ncbi:hypothetical protein Hypma_003531 [Hypsizygus marmoreus]|uniref:Zn(2)-C6 fungal-type domain-containing protein n=1 Tax=Hypsizygus marmoreus TaxID=39966 RepID=A0A369J1Y6_HYPMA|nr:hypothetical protein Hypma_003531 [Hypsizygus marmoreus]
MSLQPSEGSSRKGRKGNTCLNCRRRKIKCDGDRPTCGQCEHGGPTFEDCEYPGESPTPTQLLEQRISVVKSRIRAIEVAEHTEGITLHHPYRSDDAASSAYRSVSSSEPSWSPGPHPLISGSPPSHASMPSEEYFEEPSPEQRQIILNTFLFNGHQFGFFLNVDRFLQSLVLSRPMGDYTRPTPGLLSAAYLWASHLAGIPQEETLLLNNTLRHVARDPSSSHPQRTVNSIQAEVLLSYYFLKDGKMLQGSYHADAALSLTLAAGLHRIRSPTGHSVLPYPIDAIEEGERIDAFWTVLRLNNYWTAIQESHSTLHEFRNAAVDTPWPMEAPEHESYILPVYSSATLREFLEGTSAAGVSDKALHTKAAILLERATSLHTSDESSSGRSSAFPSPGSQAEWILQSDSFVRLDFLINTFASSLPLVDRLFTSSSKRDIQVVTQLLVQAAIIKLHMPFVGEFQESRQKVVFAARVVAHITMSFITTDTARLYVDPIIGIVWALASEALMMQIIQGNNGDFADLEASLEIILNQLTRFSESNELFRSLLIRYQKLYISRSSSSTGP